MTKEELIERMASDAAISKKKASHALASFLNAVMDGVKTKKGKVSLMGFGTFYKFHRKARKGSNPRTGKPLRIKARDVVKFRPGTRFKQTLS